MAANSTNCIGDIKTVQTNGPSNGTLALAIAQAGPIMDYIGNVDLVKHKLQECVELIGLSGVPKGLITNTAAGDPNLTTLTAVSNALTGGSAPSSTLVTNMTTVISNGPNTTTSANAIAQGGPIMDYLGICKLVKTKLQEAAVLLANTGIPLGIINVTSASTDGTNLGLLQGVAQVLV
jgi:hypothetical protein